MARKALSMWIFGILTAASLLHLVEAISVLIFDGEARLLQLYPLLGGKLQDIPPTGYFWVSALATVVLWGITCAIAFDNPVEAFLNKMLSDAKRESGVEDQIVMEKSELLDIISETVLTNNTLVGQIKDILYNIRGEVKRIQPLEEDFERITKELANLRKGMERLEEINYLKNVNLSPLQKKPLHDQAL